MVVVGFLVVRLRFLVGSLPFSESRDLQTAHQRPRFDGPGFERFGVVHKTVVNVASLKARLAHANPRGCAETRSV